MLQISLIPMGYKIGIGIALLTAATAGGAWLGHSLTDDAWQLKDTKRIAEAQKANLKAAQVVRDRETVLTAKNAALDAQYQQELSDAQTKIDTLRRAVRAGTVRLSIKSKPVIYAASGTNPAAASVAHAEARCELDGQAADDLISITADGDAAIRQLTALQNYVKTILLIKE